MFAHRLGQHCSHITSMSHYRHDSHVPSPRVAPWDDANPSTNSAGVSTLANKHLSGALQSVVPSPHVLPWNAHARENDGGSPTPAPWHLRPSRTHRTIPYVRDLHKTYTIRPTLILDTGATTFNDPSLATKLHANRANRANRSRSSWSIVHQESAPVRRGARLSFES
jgi:hypothetical protein